MQRWCGVRGGKSEQEGERREQGRPLAHALSLSHTHTPSLSLSRTQHTHAHTERERERERERENPGHPNDDGGWWRDEQWPTHAR